MTVKVQLPPAPQPYLWTGELPADFYSYEELLSESEREKVDRIRDFFRTEVAPIVDDYWGRAEFPFQLVEGFAKLGLLDWADPDSSEPAPSNLLTGITAMEMAHADPSLSVFFGVHSGLAMGSIITCGSEDQKRRWLPAMSRFEKIGAFALTEPHGGSDVAGGMETTARREGDEWVLNGAKRWIGNATFADVVVVWARDVETNRVLGFVVEKGTPGFTATKIENKFALRIVQNADIVLDECRVPEANRLQNANSFRDTAEILRRTRSGVAWQAVGVQFAAYEIALQYAKERDTVRPPDRQVPDGPGPAGEDARQRHGIRRDDGAPGPVAARRCVPRRAVRAGEGLLRVADARERALGAGVAGRQRHCSRLQHRPLRLPIPRLSTPTRAPARCRR